LAADFDLKPHGRNQWLSDAVPFIFRAFSKEIGIELAVLHLRAYQGLYSGDETEHRAAFESLWAGCENSYPAELSTTEQDIYKTLKEPELSAFRICRDLACRKNNLQFPMSCYHLETRLARPRHVNGGRILRAFQHGIISLVKKGEVGPRDLHLLVW